MLRSTRGTLPPQLYRELLSALNHLSRCLPHIRGARFITKIRPQRLLLALQIVQQLSLYLPTAFPLEHYSRTSVKLLPSSTFPPQ